MPSTAVAGVDGSFTFGTFTAIVAAWSGDIIQDVNDCSGFENQPWRKNLGGMKVLRGSFSGYFGKEGATTILANITSNTAAFTLAVSANTTTGTHSFTGAALMSNVRVGTGINGNATVAGDFVSDGVVTGV